MSVTDDIRRPIEHEIKEYKRFLARHMRSDNEFVGDILDYIIDNGGKGIRPMMVLLAAAMLNPRPERGLGLRSYLAAMLVEMMHTASLVHDDVIDESDLRRGKPSVRAMWGSRNAVITGDFILARSITTGLESAQYDIVDYISRSMGDLCEGELIQGEQSRTLGMTREIYLDIIGKKTATLFAVSAGVGALSVGASKSNVATMRSFGQCVGMAFQIRDDIMDYEGGADTGKPLAGDLREQKITLPLLSILEKATPERRVELLGRLRDVYSEPDNIEWLRSAVIAGGGIEEARRVMNSYVARAHDILSAWPPSPAANSLAILASHAAWREK